MNISHNEKAVHTLLHFTITFQHPRSLPKLHLQLPKQTFHRLAPSDFHINLHTNHHDNNIGHHFQSNHNTMGNQTAKPPTPQPPYCRCLFCESEREWQRHQTLLHRHLGTKIPPRLSTPKPSRHSQQPRNQKAHTNGRYFKY